MVKMSCVLILVVVYSLCIDLVCTCEKLSNSSLKLIKFLSYTPGLLFVVVVLNYSFSFEKFIFCFS